MKTATVADLRNNFATVSKWIHAGEAVTITKRGIAFATLAPVRRKKTAAPIDRTARLRKIFPRDPRKGIFKAFSTTREVKSEHLYPMRFRFNLTHQAAFMAAFG
jgi:antitoxin (DNA-binding transcriptional repressor) of toxin-antitoxin stability system